MQTVFITGATAGLGSAIAKRLVHDGHCVVLTGRRTDRLNALAADLKSHAKQLLVLPLDVRDAKAVNHAVEQTEKILGPISVLVNNAGLALGLEPAQAASAEDWKTMVDTNIQGVLNTTHAILPKMVERKAGYLIQLGSVAGSYPYPGGNVYAATKAFVHQFSLGLRADLLGTGVRVTSIEPGMVETEFSEVRFKGDHEKAKAVYRGLDALTAEDIAETIAWCLSLPPRVNINRLEVMPTAQAFGAFATHRTRATEKA